MSFPRIAQGLSAQTRHLSKSLFAAVCGDKEAKALTTDVHSVDCDACLDRQMVHIFSRISFLRVEKRLKELLEKDP